MYVFYEIDPFNPALVQENVRDRASLIPVRRPFLGIENKKETYATLQILSQRNGHWEELLNSSAPPESKEGGQGKSSGTANFFITQIRHSRQERVQIVETYADTFLYVFGGAPKMLEIQGALLNTANFPWRTEWLRNYDTHMSAGKTIENAARVYLTVDDTTYEGYLVSCDIVDQVDPPGLSPMQFVMYLTNIIFAEVYGSSIHSVEEGQPFTRTSPSEYVNHYSDGENLIHAADAIYSLDEYGNIVAQDRNRLKAEELARRRAESDIRAAKKVKDVSPAGQDYVGHCVPRRDTARDRSLESGSTFGGGSRRIVGGDRVIALSELEGL